MSSRTPALLLAATLTLTLTGCGTSPEQDAYLDVIRDRSAALDIDEDAELARGQQVCDTLVSIKPEDRIAAAIELLQRGYASHHIQAAADHLCPELKVPL